MAQPVRRDVVGEGMEVIARRRWSLVIPTVVISALTMPIVLSLPATYRSSTLILVEAQKIPEAFVRPTVTEGIETRLNSIGQQILSRTRLERVIEEFGLYRQKESAPRSWIGRWFSEPKEQGANTQAGVPLALVERMQRDIEIVVKDARDGNTFSISYVGDDPETVMNVTNRLAAHFIEENLKLREAQAEGTSEFLENELQSIKVKLESQEEALRAFKQQYMGELPEQLDTNLRTLDRLQMERQTLQDALRNAEDRYAILSRQSPERAPEGARSGLTATARLQAAQSRLASLLTEYKDGYPDVVVLRKEIAAIEAEVAAQPVIEGSSAPAGPAGHKHEDESVPHSHGEAEESVASGAVEQRRQIAAVKRRQEAVANQILAYERHVENTPLREQQLAMILRDYDNVQKAYQSLLDKLQDARIAESLERRQKGEIFRVLDPANRPDRPYQPNRALLILVGVGLGLGAGIGLVLLREQLDASIKSEADLIEATTGIPLLAVIPMIESNSPRQTTGDPASAKGPVLFP